MPPVLPSGITVVTLEDRTRYAERYAEYEKCQRDAIESWIESWNKRLEKARVRLLNIKESLKTCQGESVDHWRRELQKQEEMIERLESERIPDNFHAGIEPSLPGIKAVKGKWLLTEARDTCGEWKEQ